MQQEERSISSRQNTLRLRTYQGAGKGGPSVIALHGLGSSVDVLRDSSRSGDPFEQLALAGFNVAALDWPGHGRSAGPRGRMTYRLAMEAVADAAEAVGDHWEGPVGVFGTALGGVLAFYAALETPRIAAAACHNVLDLRDVRPVLQRHRQGVLLPLAARLRTADGVLDAIRVPTIGVVAAADLAEDPALSRALRRHPQWVSSYDLRSLISMFLTPEDKPALTAQTTPTFLAVGSSDRVLPDTHTRAFASRLQCDHELWVLPGAGHQLLLEHGAALLPAAGAFLHQHLA